MTLGLRKLRQIAPNAVNVPAYDPYTRRIPAVCGDEYGAAYGDATRGATRRLTDPTLIVGMVSNTTSRNGAYSPLQRPALKEQKHGTHCQYYHV